MKIERFDTFKGITSVIEETFDSFNNEESNESKLNNFIASKFDDDFSKQIKKSKDLKVNKSDNKIDIEKENNFKLSIDKKTKKLNATFHKDNKSIKTTKDLSDDDMKKIHNLTK